MQSQPDTAELLNTGRADRQTVRDELMTVVYNELRQIANSYLQRERPNHTLQPTALVHEVYLRIVGQENVRWQNREHFVGIAAQMMRRVLVDYARGHNREKRGGGLYKMSLAEADRLLSVKEVDLVMLDEALNKLALKHPQKSRIVELRFFGGLSIEETAKVLRVSDSTVERDWKFARAWLLREVSSEDL